MFALIWIFLFVRTQNMETSFPTQRVGVVGYGHLGLKSSTKLTVWMIPLLYNNVWVDVWCRAVPGGQDPQRWTWSRSDPGFCVEQEFWQAQGFSSSWADTGGPVVFWEQVLAHIINLHSSVIALKYLISTYIYVFIFTLNNYHVLQAVRCDCRGLPSTDRERIWGPVSLPV